MFGWTRWDGLGRGARSLDRGVKLRAVIVFVLFAGGVLAAQLPRTSATYQWSGELVAFDDAAKTLTVKARIAYAEALDELKRFKAGDRVLLMWSGFDTYADAIRRVRSSADSPKSGEHFLLPVELVSTEAPNQYVTFRLRVPDISTETLRMIKPGEWVTVTSPHEASGERDAITAIRSFTATTGRAD